MSQQEKHREMEHNNTKLEGSRDAHTQDSDLAVGLLPCPFCGDKAKPFTLNGFYWVECVACDGGVRSIIGPETAIKKWNTRQTTALQTRLSAEVERREAAEAVVDRIPKTWFLDSLTDIAKEYRLKWKQETAALAQEVRRLTEEKDRWRLALEGLTAGGSEFVNDLDNCLAYIERRRTRDHETLKAKCREVKQLREEKEIAVKVGDDDDEDYETSGPEPCDECGFHACHCDCRCGAFRSGRQIADCVC